MGNEILNIGISHRSNHLLTQFYNLQESLLYSKTADGKKKNDPSVYLSTRVDKINKLVDYTPRCLLWDAKNGNGSLGKYQYAATSTDDHFYGIGTDRKVQPSGKDYGLSVEVQTHARIPRSTFQNNLDQGILQPSSDNFEGNTTENFQYWSDYNKLIYHPQTLFSCQDWYHNGDSASAIPTNVPLNSNVALREEKSENVIEPSFITHFTNSQAGADLWDNNLHYWLEQSDNLSHINIVAEFDTAWGALSNELLKALKDELPKISLYQFSLASLQPTTSNGLLNIITNTLQSLEYIDLLFPLHNDDNNKTLYDQTSQQAVVFETIASLFDNTEIALTTVRQPHDLTNMLTLDSPERKIITNLTSSVTQLDQEMTQEHGYFSKFVLPASFKPWKLKKLNTHVFHECEIHRVNNPDELVKKHLSENSIFTYGLDRSHINTFFTEPSKEILNLHSLGLKIQNSPMVNVLKYWESVLTSASVRKTLMLFPTSNISSPEDIDELVENLEILKNAYILKNQYSLYDSDESSSEDDDN
ncbi:hypothetical protein ACO0QE_002333 [Hanseniaspora vineae]